MADGKTSQHASYNGHVGRIDGSWLVVRLPKGAKAVGSALPTSRECELRLATIGTCTTNHLYLSQDLNLWFDPATRQPRAGCSSAVPIPSPRLIPNHKLSNLNVFNH